MYPAALSDPKKHTLDIRSVFLPRLDRKAATAVARVEYEQRDPSRLSIPLSVARIPFVGHADANAIADSTDVRLAIKTGSAREMQEMPLERVSSMLAGL